MTTAFDDFSGYSNGDIATVAAAAWSEQAAGAADWAQNVASEVGATGGKVAAITRTTAAAANNLIVNDLIGGTTGDIEIVSRFKVANAAASTAAMGPMLIAADGQAYGLNIDGAGVRLYRFSTSLAPSTSIPNSAGNTITLTVPDNGYLWIRLGRSGSTIRAKAWLDGSAEPGSWQVQGTNTTLTTVKGGFGTRATQRAPLTVDVFGIGTGTDAAPTAGLGQLITPSGKASEAVYGTHTLANAAAQPIAPSGQSSAAVYGTHIVQTAQRTAAPAGIASAAVFGTHTLVGNTKTVTAPGIESAVVYGTHAIADVQLALAPSGVASAAVYGGAVFSEDIVSFGVDTPAVFGTHSLSAANTKNILHSGEGSAAVYGAHTLANVAPGAIAGSGIASAAAYGTAVITNPDLVIAPLGITSEARFGAMGFLGGIQPTRKRRNPRLSPVRRGMRFG